MKKLIVVDLDGTLLNSSGVCSRLSSDYLKKLKNDGHIIVIATGRRLCSALEVTNNAYFANYIICDCGSGIYNVDTNNFIYKSVIDNIVMSRLYKLAKEYCLSFKLCTPNNLFDLINDNLQEYELKDLLEKLNDVLHITIDLKGTYEIIEIKNKLKQELPELEFLIMQNSFADRKWFDICNIKNSKYNSILKISGLEKIKNDDIICFGDGLNDIEMLKKCGVGVAMGNALNEVKEASDFVTSSFDKDGIFVFLDEYLK